MEMYILWSLQGRYWLGKRVVIFFSGISSPDGGRDIALRGSRGLRPFVIRAQLTSHSPFPIISLTRLCTP